MQAYDRRDVDSILEYLQAKATEISEGRWTDFSNGDIGTILLKLIAYMADMNNYQIDKALAEMYLDTVTERESAVSITRLIGYEPRGYKSARTDLSITLKPGFSVADGTKLPKYTRFTDSSNSISFYNIIDYLWLNNAINCKVFEGVYSVENKTMSDVDANARIYLNTSQVDPETLTLIISGDTLVQVENVLTDTSSDLKYSVHTDSSSMMYIQLPSFWQDLISTSSSIQIEYLVSNGTNGNAGAHTITRAASGLNISVDSMNIVIDNEYTTTGAYDPETIEEIQKGAQMFASTMNTLVTLDDIQLCKYKVPGIVDIVALDYNDPDSGLVQPADAYKVNVYVLPKDSDVIIEDGELTEVGKALKAYIDERRLTSIMVDYKNVVMQVPIIRVEAHINKYDLRADSLEANIKRVIMEHYGRGKLNIGESIYISKLSKQILDEIDYCNYITITPPSTPGNDWVARTKRNYLNVLEENIQVTVVEE